MIQLNPARRVRVYDSKNPAVVYEGQAIAVSYYQGNDEADPSYSLLCILDMQAGDAAPQMREVVVPMVPGGAETVNLTTWRVEDHGELWPVAVKSGE